MSLNSPTNITELRQFMGIVNFQSRFIRNYADISAPLRNLLRKDVPWIWSEVQEQAFRSLKSMIAEAPVLAYYDPKRELVVENDASEYGLGTVLLQDGHPIAYASRSLTECEKRYAQIEKEMLAVVFGVEKFHHYTYGRNVTVVTDHKPLVSIFSKPLSKTPRRLQSFLIRIFTYNVELIYRPGKTIPVADGLSRQPLQESSVRDEGREIISNLSLCSVPAEQLDEIRRETESDETLHILKITIMNGWPADRRMVNSVILPYHSYREELTVQDGIVLRADRIVIPASLRTDMLRRAHTGHQGINACLRRARELIYWPGMSSQLRQYVEACDTCATFSMKQQPETLNFHPLVSRPWQKVGVDLFSFQDRQYLITVCYYSTFYEIDCLKDTTSTTVINKLQNHFARYGSPDTVISDGGPQFISKEFREFSKLWKFNHHVTSPYNTKANGAAEAAVKSAKNIMKKSVESKEDPFIGFLNARNTPTEGLTTSPAQRLMNRKTRTLIPTLSRHLMPIFVPTQQSLRENRRIKVAQKMDIHRKDLPALQKGDTVRIQPRPGEKKWQEATVSNQTRSRTYEVVNNEGKTYKRNRQFLRKTAPRTSSVVHDVPAWPANLILLSFNLLNSSSSVLISFKTFSL